MDARQEGDYADFLILTENDLKPLVEKTEYLISTIRQLLPE